MTTVKEITIIEEILLRADANYRYLYTIDELIKSEKYLKDIGVMTNIFLSVQVEYSKTLDKNSEDYNKKLTEYHNHLTNGLIDYDTTECRSFLDKLELKYFNEELKELMKKLNDLQ